MSDNLRKYTRGLYALDAVAARVPDDAWDNPSCCDGWTAREAAGHAAWLIKDVGSIAAGHGSIAEQAEAEVLGDDPGAAMREIVTTTLAQLDQQGSLGVMVDKPFGQMPIDAFIGILWVDALVHAWDVADAVGIAHGIDPAFAAAAHAQLEPRSDSIRGPGRFDPAIETAADDPVAMFIAFTGRTPVGGG